MELREHLRKFFIVACNLQRENADNYLATLSENDEENYNFFTQFAMHCSNTLLSVMHQLGYCANDERLHSILKFVLIMRYSEGYESDDAGGHTARFRRSWEPPVHEVQSNQRPAAAVRSPGRIHESGRTVPALILPRPPRPQRARREIDPEDIVPARRPRLENKDAGGFLQNNAPLPRANNRVIPVVDLSSSEENNPVHVVQAMVHRRADEDDDNDGVGYHPAYMDPAMYSPVQEDEMRNHEAWLQPGHGHDFEEIEAVREEERRRRLEEEDQIEEVSLDGERQGEEEEQDEEREEESSGEKRERAKKRKKKKKKKHPRSSKGDIV